MAISLTTPIQNPFAFPRITKIIVNNIQHMVSRDVAVPPFLNIELDIWGPADVLYGTRTLQAYDALASTCLRKKVTPLNQGDLVEIYGATITGLYTRLLTAYHANVTGTGRQAELRRLKALEDDLIPSGILTADFAGT